MDGSLRGGPWNLPALSSPYNHFSHSVNSHQSLVSLPEASSARPFNPSTLILKPSLSLILGHDNDLSRTFYGQQKSQVKAHVKAQVWNLFLVPTVSTLPPHPMQPFNKYMLRSYGAAGRGSGEMRPRPQGLTILQEPSKPLQFSLSRKAMRLYPALHSLGNYYFYLRSHMPSVT